VRLGRKGAKREYPTRLRKTYSALLKARVCSVVAPKVCLFVQIPQAQGAL